MYALETFIAFTQDMDAVEKTLRLLQASCSAATSLAPTSYGLPAAQVKGHINRSRRFFRVFMWVDCWSIAAKPQVVVTLHDLLSRLAYGWLGMYLFLDMLLLPCALGALDERGFNVVIYQLSRSEGVGFEAIEHASFVCWFYAMLLFAGAMGLEAFASTREAVREAVKDSKGQAPAGNSVTRRSGRSWMVNRVFWRTSCDILVSGAAARRIIIHPTYVAVAMAISSLLSMQEIWVAIHTRKTKSKAKQATTMSNGGI